LIQPITDFDISALRSYSVFFPPSALHGLPGKAPKTLWLTVHSGSPHIGLACTKVNQGNSTNCTVPGTLECLDLGSAFADACTCWCTKIGDVRQGGSKGEEGELENVGSLNVDQRWSAPEPPVHMPRLLPIVCNLCDTWHAGVEVQVLASQVYTS
jgi:hypothetical protein